jgi:hypothetical protein
MEFNGLSMDCRHTSASRMPVPVNHGWPSHWCNDDSLVVGNLRENESAGGVQ